MRRLPHSAMPENYLNFSQLFLRKASLAGPTAPENSIFRFWALPKLCGKTTFPSKCAHLGHFSPKASNIQIFVKVLVCCQSIEFTNEENFNGSVFE